MLLFVYERDRLRSYQRPLEAADRCKQGNYVMVRNVAAGQFAIAYARPTFSQPMYNL
jgi:hypothetical protein